MVQLAERIHASGEWIGLCSVTCSLFFVSQDLSILFRYMVIHLSLHYLLCHQGLSSQTRGTILPYDMTGSAFYLLTTAGGTCAEATPSGVFDKKCTESSAQQWTAEYGNDSNVVAFRNAGNGKYLRATGGNHYAAVTTSDDKQWWTLEQDNPAGSFW